MFEGDICKTPGCEKAGIYLYHETENEHQVEGYCSFDCMITNLRRLKCPACDTLMDYDSETAFFTCSSCGQRLRW